MAIIFVKETYGRSYINSITGMGTGVRTFFVLANTNYTVLDSLVSDAVVAGLPALGAAYSASSPSLVAYNHVPQEISKETKFYSVEVQYQTNQLSFAAPTARPWRIRMGSVLEDYVPLRTYFDTTGETLFSPVGAGEWICNTAGFDFDPPVVDYRTLSTIRLSKNVSAISDIGDSTITGAEDLLNMVNTVNDDYIVVASIIGGTFELWMEDIQISNEENNGESYYAVEFTIRRDPAKHIHLTLNAGFQDSNGNTILDDNGGEISNPWPLDINGDPIRGGAAVRQLNAVYLAFGIKPTANWARLGLPTSF